MAAKREGLFISPSIEKTYITIAITTSSILAIILPVIDLTKAFGLGSANPRLAIRYEKNVAASNSKLA